MPVGPLLRRSPVRTTALAATLVLAVLMPGAPAAAQTGDGSPYIVVLRDRTEARGVSREHAERFQARVSQVYGRVLSGYAARISDRHLERLRADPRVAFVAPDRPVEAAGSVPLSGDTVPNGVRRTGAATPTSSRQASTVNVAVLDSGIDLRHPDLNAREGKNCYTQGASAADDHGHGTHVAGTIAAANNGGGVVGVAPGTLMYAVKVFSSAASGNTSHLICGIEWAVANSGPLNIKVLNLSLGVPDSYNDNNCGRSNYDPLHQAVCNATAAGLNVVAAAGNEAGDLARSAPANYPEVLAVTSIADSDGQPGGFGGATCRGRADDTTASSSNFATATSEATHTLAAPGECVLSAAIGGGYNTRSGTSMASAHVSGSVALCIGDGGVPGRCAGKTPAQVIQQLRADAAAVDAGFGFVGDPNRPQGSQYFGHLVWDGQVVAADTPPAPVLAGATFYSDGTISKSGPAGTRITAFATGAESYVPYKLVTGRDGGNPRTPCSTDVVPVLDVERYAGSTGFVSPTSGLIYRSPGTWQVCFRDSTPGAEGRTITAVMQFTVQ